jgi:hypothetical protein
MREKVFVSKLVDQASIVTFNNTIDDSIIWRMCNEM